MNKHILLVMKWLDNKDSVTQDELISNKADAAAAYAAAYAAYAAADAAADADAKYWVNRYFAHSDENKQDYINALISTRNICDTDGVVKDKVTEEQACFDLMFHACQTIHAKQAVEILEAIKDGKVRGVKWVGEES